MKRLLPVGYVYWAWSITWNGDPFRVLYIGLWCLSIDRSHKFWKRWPHMSITWNDSVHN